MLIKLPLIRRGDVVKPHDGDHLYSAVGKLVIRFVWDEKIERSSRSCATIFYFIGLWRSGPTHQVLILAFTGSNPVRPANFIVRPIGERK